MLKKSGVILLGLLVLAGCGNPTKKAEKEVSSFLSKEYAEAKKICLAEYSEDECEAVDFTISYNKKEDTMGLFIVSHRESSVSWSGTYENSDAFIAEIYNLVRKSGVESEFLIFTAKTSDNQRFSLDDGYVNGVSISAEDEYKIPYLLRKIGLDPNQF